MPNTGPRHTTPAPSHTPVILGAVILALLFVNTVALLADAGITSQKSPPNFADIHLPTMSTVSVAKKRNDVEERDDNNDSASQETESSEGKTEDARSIALIIAYAKKDPNWSDYSKEIRGCIATQLVRNPTAFSSNTVERCKDYYNE